MHPKARKTIRFPNRTCKSYLNETGFCSFRTHSFLYSKGAYSYVGGPGNTHQGGHGVTIVGYDDANQYFLVKNSRAVGWGEAGFFRIAYNEVSDQRYVQFG
ncbi:MAG: C1 family peptidase [Syntrophobacteraceae bacterium]